MICPQCKTDNRDDRAECYHCGQELTTLRMIVNRARNHYNEALQHAERGRDEEAIRELQHALELDASFVEAWLVLGTLHARSEQMGEARTAWQKALAIDPRFERGHQYLLKMQQIEPSLPAMRRLKIATLVLGSLLAVAIVFGVIQSRPDTGLQKIDAALKLREEGRSAAALEKLADAKSDPLASSKAKRAAGALGEEISERLKDRTDAIARLAESGRYEEAIAGIGALEAIDPPGWVQQQLGAIRAKMGESMTEAAQAEVARFRSGKLAYDELSTRLGGWMKLVEGGPSHERLAGLLEEATGEHRRTLLARLRPEILAIEDDALAAQRIDELAVQHPELKTDLEEMLRSRLAVVAEAGSNEFDRLVRAGRLNEARERLTALRAVYEGLGRTAPADVTAKMEAAVADAEKKIAVRTFHDAFDARDYEQALELAAAAEQSAPDDAARADVRARRDEAERLLGGQLWNWSEGLDREFETLTVSLEDARRMAGKYGLILRHAPAAESTYRATHTLFRAAASELRLGNAAGAQALVARLKSEYPDSAVLKYTAFRRFEERLAEALKRG